MRTPSTSVVPDFMPWALAVANVGTWRCSLTEERVRCDSVMAEMYGLTEAEAHLGVSFARIRDIIHPDDRHLFDRKNDDVRGRGGYIVLEYRIVPRPGVVRWILVRGRYEPFLPNRVDETGHGIAIDITATRGDGPAGHGPFRATSDFRMADALTALDRAADAAITLRQEIGGLDADVPGLQTAVDVVLRLLGHRLAKDVPRDAVD